MTDAKYMRPGIDFATGKLVEELGELQAAIGKTMRWGRDSFNPELPPAAQEPNWHWIEREIDDVLGAIANYRKEAGTAALEQAGEPVEKLHYSGYVMEAVQQLLERGRATLDSEGYLVSFPAASPMSEIQRLGQEFDAGEGKALDRHGLSDYDGQRQREIGAGIAAGSRSLSIDESGVDIIAQAIYEMNPCGEQPTDLDGRPTGPGAEIPWSDMVEYDPEYHAACMEAARKVAAVTQSRVAAEPVGQDRNEAIMALTAKFGPILKAAFPNEHSRTRFDAANALAEVAIKRAMGGNHE